LLQLAKDNRLPESLKPAAGTELNNARWPALKSQAAELLPLPAPQNLQPLPPFAELQK